MKCLIRWSAALCAVLCTLSGCEQPEQPTPAAVTQSAISKDSGAVDRSNQAKESNDRVDHDSGEILLTSSESTPENPVSVLLYANRTNIKPGESFEVILELKIDAPWELHDLEATPQGHPTTLKLSLPESFESNSDWIAPKATQSQRPEGGGSYSGTCRFRRTVVVRDSSASGVFPLSCKIEYQACDVRRCLRPATVQLAGEVTVDSRSIVPN
ncbi:MAG: hypothetical protein JNL58_28920 [Planctomyces sp.]|nr:hypothetical protein [Planctomyces sp.]